MSEMVPTGSKYSDQDRTGAVIQYAVLGSLAKVERATGISDSTLSLWMKSDWAIELIGEVRSEKADEHRAQYSQIVDKAQQVTLAKLDDATAAQANLIACQATDKVRLADNMPTSIRADVSNNSILSFLEQLSDQYHESRVVSTQHTTSSGCKDKD